VRTSAASSCRDDRKNWRNNFFVPHEVIRGSIVWFNAGGYAGAKCAGKSAPAGR
jgi:hypothetical protein